jgi:DNA-binding IclR family transcriptional regulator
MTDIEKDQSYDRSAEGADHTMRVLGALANKEVDFRTSQGIARETGVSEDSVQAILTGLVELDVAREPLVQQSGKNLYTLSSRRPSWKEYLARLKENIATW